MPLSNKQIYSINEATAAFNIWVGAVSSGKTFGSIIAFIDFLKNGPPGDVMIIGVSRATIRRISPRRRCSTESPSEPPRRGRHRPIVLKHTGARA